MNALLDYWLARYDEAYKKMYSLISGLDSNPAHVAKTQQRIDYCQRRIERVKSELLEHAADSKDYGANESFKKAVR